MTILESTRTFLLNCPLFTEQTLHTDFLPEAAPAFTLEAILSAEDDDGILATYIDGGTLRQFPFHLAARQPYTAADTAANTAFVQGFADWVAQQESLGNLPQLPGNREAIHLETQSTGYSVGEKTETTARYTLPCRLVYYQGGMNS